MIMWRGDLRDLRANPIEHELRKESRTLRQGLGKISHLWIFRVSFSHVSGMLAVFLGYETV